MIGDDIATPDDALIGRIIAGKFGLKRCVGTGASGSVFQADQLTLGRTVAVKILRDELTRDARFVARFHDEALAASRLNHPNTVSVIDYGQTEDGLLYLVMEFLRGPTLTQVLRSETLTAQRAADLVSQILAGLEEAHEAGVVHADLKSDNVVVERRRGDWDLVKVVDFGIARLVGKPTKNNAERTICGTPEYMAPEVIQGDDPTFASDLYAVGVVLYEVLTGQTPFQGGATMEVLRRHITEAPLPPSLRRPDLRIDPILEESTMRALSKDHRRRFATAVEFRTALQRVLGHRVERGAAVAACSACGTVSPLSFKFCPDCGHPRHAAAAPSLLMLDELGLATGSGPVSAAPSIAGESPTQDVTPSDFDPEETSAAVRVLEQRDVLGVSTDLPFVGRGAELDRVLGFMSASTEDNALQISGPPGSGRTRLVEEALAALGQGTSSAVARPDPTGLQRAFHPMRGLVRAVLGFGRRDTGEDLASMLEAVGMTHRDLPAITDLLTGDGPMLQLEPAVRRRELLASLVRLLVAQAEHDRIVLVLDDVDRYDNPSQDVVRRLIEVSRGRRQLRLVIANTPDLAGRWPEWVTRVELAPLDRTALGRVSEHAVAREGLPGAGTIEELSGGSPAYAQHLVRFALEGGAPGTAPAGLADLVAARIDHLPHAAKRLCQAVAAAGLEAPVAWLAKMADIDPEQVRQVLSIVIGRGLLRETEAGARVMFPSLLVRDVVYEATPAKVRRDLHASIAASLGPSQRDPSVLGHHLELAGELEEASRLLGLAADRAATDLDDAGARRLYQRALGAARRVMLSDDDPSKREHFVMIGIKLAESLRQGGELGLARGLLDEVRLHCQESRSLQAHVLRASAQLHGSDGDTQGAVGLLREAIGLAIVSGQRDLLCELYLDIATTHLRSGNVMSAAGELAEGIDMVTTGEGPDAADGPDALWRLCYRLSQFYGMESRRTDAVRIGEHGLRHALRVGAHAGAARLQSMLASQVEQMGDPKRAAELRRRAVDEMRRLGDRRATAELLLDNIRPTKTYSRIEREGLQEARDLAEEIGWTEGVRRASEATPQ
ncbi:MAG TPA: protein kinase [Kofleriaceae bacterium]|nr:protein kinase [Kofleriaceae bacterium]